MIKNPTSDDIAICPHCENDLFHIIDGNRLFCSKCKKEVRNNENFQEGTLVN